MATPFVSRAGWGARPPRSRTFFNPEGITVHYGGGSPWGGANRSSAAAFAGSTDHGRCAGIVRSYQNHHMDGQQWADLAYSSLVCPHGTRYEGRGPGVRTAANGTNAGNSRSHAVCYIAGDADPLTHGAMLAFSDEQSRLRALRWGHRDWLATACPGAPTWSWRLAGFPHPGGGSAPQPEAPKRWSGEMDLAQDGAGTYFAVGGQGKNGRPIAQRISTALAAQMHIRGARVLVARDTPHHLRQEFFDKLVDWRL